MVLARIPLLFRYVPRIVRENYFLNVGNPFLKLETVETADCMRLHGEVALTGLLSGRFEPATSNFRFLSCAIGKHFLTSQKLNSLNIYLTLIEENQKRFKFNSICFTSFKKIIFSYILMLQRWIFHSANLNVLLCFQ